MPGRAVALSARHDSLRIWFDCHVAGARRAQSVGGDDDEDDDDDDFYPNQCQCGWHLLCDTDRLSALNDQNRMGSYRAAIEVVSDKFVATLKGNGDCSGNGNGGIGGSRTVIALDVSDGSTLAFMLASLTKVTGSIHIVSMEKKQVIWSCHKIVSRFVLGLTSTFISSFQQYFHHSYAQQIIWTTPC